MAYSRSYQYLHFGDMASSPRLLHTLSVTLYWCLSIIVSSTELMQDRSHT